MCYYFFSFWYSIQLQKESIFWNYTFLKFESKKIFHKLIKKPTEGQQKKKKEQFWNSAYLHVSTDQSFHVSKKSERRNRGRRPFDPQTHLLSGSIPRKSKGIFDLPKFPNFIDLLLLNGATMGGFFLGIFFFFSLSLSLKLIYNWSPIHIQRYRPVFTF